MNRPCARSATPCVARALGLELPTQRGVAGQRAASRPARPPRRRRAPGRLRGRHVAALAPPPVDLRLRPPVPLSLGRGRRGATEVGALSSI